MPSHGRRATSPVSLIRPCRLKDNESRSGGQRELAVRYETEPDELVGVLTERHIDGLLNPLGTATSKLQVTTPASEGRIIADLYWRCCIAMQMSAFCKSNRARLQPGCSRCVRRYARLWAIRCAR